MADGLQSKALISNELMRKIIYLGYAPLNLKSSRDFFIHDLKRDGLDVEYWDLTEIYFPHLKLASGVEEDWIFKINHLRDFKDKLEEYRGKEVVFFMTFPFDGSVRRLYRILTQGRHRIHIITKGMLPIPSLSSGQLLSKILNKLSVKNIQRFLKNKLALAYKSLNLVKTFDTIYFAGADSLKIAGVGFRKDAQIATLVPINSSDYDDYLLIVGGDRLIKERYVVFLDEYLPHHPDFMMFGVDTVSSDAYYASVNLYLEKIEKAFNLEVVIAAHPKAERYKERNFFNGRTVLFNKTAELVKNSEFVLAHMSTAVGFAVLSQKKVQFFYTNELSERMQSHLNIIKFYAECLGTTAINIDVSTEIPTDIESFDVLKYEDYKYCYLTSKETENRNSYEIIKETLL